MEPTTVAISKGQKKGKYNVTAEQILGAAANAALRAGLGEEGARVVQAILKTEGGLYGDRGDVDAFKKGDFSAGPLQFFTGGQLGNLARELGLSVQEAGEWVDAHPLEATEWGIKGYLGNAIRRGIEAGLRGSDLATFAQRTGQVSESPERAGRNYSALFSAGGQLLGDMNPLAARKAEAAEMEQVQPQQQQTNGFLGPDGRVVRAITGTAEAQEPDTSGKQVRTLRWYYNDGTVRSFQLDGAEWKEVGQPRVRNQTVYKEFNDALEKERATDAATAKRQEPIIREHKGGLVVVDPVTGTAKPVSGAEPKSDVEAAEANQLHVGADGNLYAFNRKTGELAPVPGAPQRPPTPVNTQANEKYIVYPDGSTKPNPNWTGNRPGVHSIGGRIVTTNPETGGITGNVPVDPEQDALDNAYKQAQIAKMQNDLVPGLEQVLRNRDAAIKGIKARFVSGELNADQATAYYKYVNDYTAAAYRGTTPMQIEQERNRQENERRRDGMQHLNQRISSGSSLASNLTSTYLQAAAAAHLGPGQSHGIDPLTLARAFVDDVGGGDMSDFARELVMGGRGGQAPIEEPLPLPPWLQNQEEEGMPPQKPAGAPIGAGAPAPPAPPMPGYPPWAGRHY